MNIELVLNLPNFKTIIVSLRFHFKVDMQVVFLWTFCLWYFFGLLVELFKIPLVDYMYDWMCKVFVGKKFAYFLGMKPF